MKSFLLDNSVIEVPNVVKLAETMDKRPSSS